MINLRHVWVLLRNDIRMSVKNGTVLFLLAMPLALSLGMSAIIGSEPPRPKMGVVGADDSQFRSFVVQSKLFEVVDATDETRARQALEKGDLNVLLLLPNEVDDRIKAGAFPEVTLMVDESRQAQAATARYLVTELSRAFAAQQVPIALTVDPIRGITSQQGMLPNWVAMALAMGITILPTILAQEKQTRTLDALMVTPLSYLDIIVGKSLFAIIAVCVAAWAILGLNGGLTGNLPLLAAIVLLGSASTVSIGLFIGLLVDTPERAGSMSSILMIPVVWSAFFADFRGPVGEVSKFFPGYHISQSLLHSMFAHATFGSEWPYLAALAGFAALAMVACIWALSRSET